MRAMTVLKDRNSIIQMLWTLLVASGVAGLYYMVADHWFPEAIPSIWELMATSLILTNVYLIVKQNNWNWPFGLVGVLLYGWVFYQYGLYSSAILNVIYFFPVQFLGWYQWVYGGKERTGVLTTWSSWPERILYLIGVGTFAAVWGGLVTKSLYANPFHAYLDAAILAASVFSQIAMSWKRIDSWIGWHTVNIMSIYLYADIGAYMTSGLYVIFLFTATKGIHNWVRIRRQERSDA